MGPEDRFLDERNAFLRKLKNITGTGSTVKITRLKMTTHLTSYVALPVGRVLDRQADWVVPGNKPSRHVQLDYGRRSCGHR